MACLEFLFPPLPASDCWKPALLEGPGAVGLPVHGLQRMALWVAGVLPSMEADVMPFQGRIQDFL